MFTNLRPGAPQYCVHAPPVVLRRRVSSDDAGAQLAGPEQPGSRRRYLDARRDAEPDLAGVVQEQVHGLRPLQPAAGRLQPVQRARTRPKRASTSRTVPSTSCSRPGPAPHTNKLLLEGGFTFYNERWIFGPEPYNINGHGPDAVVSKTESSLGILYGAANVFTTAANHQYNMRFAANYVTGSHAFKFGMQDMWGTRNYRYDTNQAQAWTFLRGIPTSITRVCAAADRPRALERGARPLRAGPLDGQPAHAQPRPPLRLPQRRRCRCRTSRRSRSCAARHYDAIDNVPNWKDLSPRIGRHLRSLRQRQDDSCAAAYNKYVASESTNMATLNNRVNTSINRRSRPGPTPTAISSPTATSAIPTRRPCRAATPAACSTRLSATSRSRRATTRRSPAASASGPNDQEVAAGVQQQLMPRVAVDFQFTHTFRQLHRRVQDTHAAAVGLPFLLRHRSAGRAVAQRRRQSESAASRSADPAFFATVPFYQVQQASNFGDVSDVYTGLRLQRERAAAARWIRVGRRPASATRSPTSATSSGRRPSRTPVSRASWPRAAGDPAHVRQPDPERDQRRARSTAMSSRRTRLM